MPKLIAHQVQVNYVGVFSKPALSSWGQGGTILGGLYEAFRPYNITIGDMRYESLSPNLADSILTVFLFNYSANYKFKWDRVEAVFNDLTEEQFLTIPEVLKRGDDWIRTLEPDFSLQSHLLTHTSHNQLSEGTAKDFLKTLSNLDIPDVGNNEGNGITFHWDIPERNWKFHLSIDLSFQVTNGLFLQFLIRIPSDRIDHVDNFQAGLALARGVLAKVGLEV